MADRITLFISRKSAEHAGQTRVLNLRRQRVVADFKVIPATLKDDDTGHIERGFRVALLNTAGHPVGSL
ncbi:MULTISPECIES: hypothetical protein [unclassified Mesorhizobium]|uniref:hypothetical protein n=1 Tax=unclassified Mesorhizobium TaxID=325217 RepID=UPI000FCB1A50|nr:MULTISPECIES: hypothetical protein [unclassified Mesorhizobium]RUT88024.1 hypothetical protein EOD14_08305 [Mesorhizobium sp. M7A.T.Ca.US.000.02.1.1]RUT90718.1 hypothetical protein EOD15_17755 [Mesorhizobium sp. M7A.T.Ca.US.000.02.2.1]